jgi:FkbM family methyltransferase
MRTNERLAAGLARVASASASEAWRLISDPRERARFFEIRRLRRWPRRTPTETSLLGPAIRLVDAGSFLHAYEEILVREMYRFTPRRHPMRVLDCGANVGISVFYWKSLDPGARITAFEPDPAIFAALAENCRRLGHTDVETVEAAAWNADGRASFWCEGADAGRFLAAGAAGHAGTEREVRTVRLRDRLTEPIDLLKLDVEGAELAILRDCADRLADVDHLYVEVHGFDGETQPLAEVLAILRDAGFRVDVRPERASRRPFVEHRVHEGMDLQVGVFARRPARRSPA